ncbi:MAG: hypothetical protein K8R02_07170 [Anaerohalosphaeraceae bacterium]|nr:hypothetical protein [Anaerohalosphaeraceae bacterium]
MCKNKLKLIALAVLVISAGAFGDIINVSNTGLWAGGSLDVGRRVTMNGSVASSGTIGFGSSVSLTGDMYGGGDIWLGKGSYINGNVTPNVGANLSVGSNVTITGSTDQAELNFDSFSVPWQSQMQNINVGTQNISGYKNSVTNLLAGEYHNFDFDKNTTLNLSAGDYSMNNFWMNKNSVVNLDTSSGDITFNVLGGFSTANNVRFLASGQGNVYVNIYENDVWLGDDSEMRAVLNVYGGDFGVGKNAELAGSFYTTNNLWLGNNSNYDYIAEAIPEPATLAFMIAGITAIVAAGKKTKNSGLHPRYT